MHDRVVFSLWDQSEALLPVYARELLTVLHGLLHFVFSVRDHSDHVLRQCHSGPLSSQGAVAAGLLLSPPLPMGSSVGRNLFRFDWLCSSFRGSAMFSRTLSPALTSSPVPHGLSTWTYFDLSRRGRTRSSSPGTVSWRTLFRRGPFFPGCW